MLFVIEHLEPKLSEWLYIEYSHAAQIVGQKRLLITNVRKPAELRKLQKIARVERKSVRELFKSSDLVILDPCAQKGMEPSDLFDKKAVVVGGILGEEPPLGRTKLLLRKTLPQALARTLGEGQFSIDGATYMVKRVSEGAPLGEVPVQHGLEIRIGRGHSVLLPYAYPFVDGKPLISRRLVAYLKRPWRLNQ